MLFSNFHETINTQIQVQKLPNVRNKKKLIPMNTIIQSLKNITKVLEEKTVTLHAKKHVIASIKHMVHEEPSEQ